MYASFHRVISRFAKHVDTQQTLPRDVFSEVLRRDMEFIGLNMVESLVQSAADQKYHGADPLVSALCGLGTRGQDVTVVFVEEKKIG